VARVAGANEALASLVEQTAADAFERSGPSVGAHLLERAATLTADERRRAQMLLGAAGAFWRAGEFEQAERVLDASVLAEASVEGRAESVRLRGLLERQRGNIERSFELLTEEAKRIEGLAPTSASALYLEAALSMSISDLPRALEAAQRARAFDEQAPLPRVLASTLRLAVGERGAPTPAEVEAAVRDLFATHDPASLAEHLVNGPASALSQLGQADRAIRLLEELAEQLIEAKAAGVLPIVLSACAQLKFIDGRWAEALVEGREAFRRADAAGLAYEAAGTAWWLGFLEASLGLEAECRQHLERARHDFVRLGIDYLYEVDVAARRLELTLDRPERALDYPIDERQRKWAGDWIEAASRVGRVDEAQSALDDLETQCGHDPAVVPTIARLRGLLAGDDEFESWFELAVTAIDKPAHRPMSRFEQARTKLLHGERRRRAGRRVDARKPLSEALETFEALRAEPWAARTRRELNATGTRIHADTPGFDELTAQELTVARAVANGATNREVAAALFLSVKTVEFHLANVYRKLDVRSRSELTRRLERATAS
jgi:DNA-binding CsgD family transcriptional regulator